MQFGELMLPPRFYYEFTAYRKGVVIWKDSFWNVVTSVGKDNVLDVYFDSGTFPAVTDWYMGLIDNLNYTTGPLEADTQSSHGGWQEGVAYSEGTRPSIAWAAASGKAKASSSTSNFTTSADATIKGGFICSDDTKGGTSGLLYSAGVFNQGSRSVLIGDVLRVNVTVSIP